MRELFPNFADISAAEIAALFRCLSASMSARATSYPRPLAPPPLLATSTHVHVHVRSYMHMRMQTCNHRNLFYEYSLNA